MEPNKPHPIPMVRLSKLSARDQENLMFLLTADLGTLAEWYSSTTAEDHAYAKKLLDVYNAQLDNVIMMHYDDVSDVSEAKQILKGIMAK